MFSTQIKFIIVLLTGSLLWGGCITAPVPRYYEPQRAVVRVSMPPEKAYRYARLTFARFGGTLINDREDMLVFTGEVHKAVLLIVEIEPHGTDSDITVSGNIMK